MHIAKLNNESLDVALENLLGRKQTDMDWKRVREKIQGKVVMVTGAAGSIGSELCRQIASFDPLALVGLKGNWKMPSRTWLFIPNWGASPNLTTWSGP